MIRVMSPVSSTVPKLAHALRCVTQPGDEVLVLAPYFPEYYCYVNMTGARMKVVPADTERFQIHFGKLEGSRYRRLRLVSYTPISPVSPPISATAS